MRIKKSFNSLHPDTTTSSHEKTHGEFKIQFKSVPIPSQKGATREMVILSEITDEESWQKSARAEGRNACVV